MTSIFICLLFTQHFTTSRVMAAVCAVLGVLLCKFLGLEEPAILLGALFGIAAALLVDRGKASDCKNQHGGGEQQ
jgi:predicted branched-subunit amino acid permease